MMISKRCRFYKGSLSAVSVCSGGQQIEIKCCCNTEMETSADRQTDTRSETVMNDRAAWPAG